VTVVLRSLGRAVLLRCPVCGQRRVFRRWMVMAEACPGCGHHFERQEGYWIGAVAINTVATLGLFVTLFVAVMVAAWPDVPWTALAIGGVALNLAFPILFYPMSKTVWVALETTIHPPAAAPEPP
jgi:uncharacterized protein (DUF983 family)